MIIYISYHNDLCYVNLIHKYKCVTDDSFYAQMALRKLHKLYLFNCIFYRRQLFRTSPISNKLIQFLLTDIGEGIREVELKNWFVKVGDSVSQFDNICLVESDKASVSISSRYDGIIKKLYYQEGEKAFVGKPLVDIETQNLVEEDDKKDEKLQSVPIDKEEKPQSVPIDRAPSKSFYMRPLATPSIRRIAMEHNIKLESIQGSGKHGRILREDIEKIIKTSKTVPVQEPSTELSGRTEPITGIKKVMVKTMTNSNSIPTFGYSDEIDVTKLILLRQEVKKYAEKRNIVITLMPFFIKALSNALTKFPILNASVDEYCENITYKPQHNIGIAMDTDMGLIVPNIKNVQNLNILQIGEELNRLKEDGRAMKLSPKDMTGGTITLSNIGILGGTYLHPLILPPELCILALGRMHVVPMFNENDQIIKGHMIIASWCADHRVVDGATLARFSNLWKEYIENPNLFFLEG